jgi:hypothetical protein
MRRGVALAIVVLAVGIVLTGIALSSGGTPQAATVTTTSLTIPCPPAPPAGKPNWIPCYRGNIRLPTTTTIAATAPPLTQDQAITGAEQMVGGPSAVASATAEQTTLAQAVAVIGGHVDVGEDPTEQVWIVSMMAAPGVDFGRNALRAPANVVNGTTTTLPPTTEVTAIFGVSGFPVETCGGCPGLPAGG